MKKSTTRTPTRATHCDVEPNSRPRPCPPLRVRVGRPLGAVVALLGGLPLTGADGTATGSWCRESRVVGNHMITDVACEARPARAKIVAMPGKYNWKSVADTAKKWVENKVTETTTADRRTREQAEGNEAAIERELEAQAGGAVLTTLFPGLGRAIERQEANRLRAEADATDRARAARVAAVVSGSRVEVHGAVNGRADDLAVTLTADDAERTLSVLLETVDAVALDRAELSAAGFAIAGFQGDGTYELVPYIESLDPGVHHVVFDGGDGDTDWFYWSDEYGAATATVSDGAIDVTMPCRNAAGQQLTLALHVPLA